MLLLHGVRMSSVVHMLPANLLDLKLSLLLVIRIRSVKLLLRLRRSTYHGKLALGQVLDTHLERHLLMIHQALRRLDALLLIHHSW